MINIKNIYKINIKILAIDTWEKYLSLVNLKKAKDKIVIDT